MQIAKNHSQAPKRDDRQLLTVQMDCTELQSVRLANADNRISPEQHVALHFGFSVTELHRGDADI